MPGKVPTWQSVTSRELSSKEARKVHTVGWSCDGRRIAAGAVDSLVRIWRVDASIRDPPQLVLKGHGAPVDQLGWDPTQPDRLATASHDRTVRLWDTKSGKCVATVQTPGENINLAWRPDGNYLAVGDKVRTAEATRMAYKSRRLTLALLVLAARPRKHY